MKIKVLHINSESSWRGGEQQIAYLIEELNKMNVINEVLCKKKSKFHNFCIENKIKHYPASFGILRLFFTVLKLRFLSKKYNIIHAHTSKSHTVSFLSQLIGMKTPLIVSRRVDYNPSKNYLTRRKYNHQRIKAIICVSNAIKKTMINYLKKTNKTKCDIIYSGIDVNKIIDTKKINLNEIYQINKNQLIIGVIAALTDQKDIFTFLETARAIMNSNKQIKFMIVGEGKLKTELKNYAKQLNIESHVIFTGFVENPIQYLKSFDLFLFTSKKEGLGTSLIDALISKIPVVATNVGGIPEIIINEKTGLLCDVGDAKELKNAVLRILNDVNLKNKLINNGFEHAKKFSKNITAKKTLETYSLFLTN